MARGPSFLLVCILLLMTATGGLATSRFLSDFGLCIVDQQLNSTASSLLSSSDMMRARAVREIPHQDLIFSTDPVVERGSAASYDKQLGEIKINDDGTYLFVIHRVGVETTSPAPSLLLEVNNATNHYVTIAVIFDIGEGSIISANVLAELKRGDKVYIHTQGANVMGDENNPFIYTVFLLYHDPITSFPRARQSALSVTGIANLSLADSIIADLEPPTVNIGEGFDSSTGVFTAPFEGLYVFNLAVTFIFKSGKSATFRRRPRVLAANVALTVNGDTRAQVNALVPPPKLYRYNYLVPARNTGITATLNLNQGDQVSLKNIIATKNIIGQVRFVGYLLS